MTPQVQTALEGLVARPLTAQEVIDIDALLPIRNDVAIAAILSAGRKRIVSRMISERGIREVCGIVAGAHFLQFLRTAEATPPTWLRPALTAAGVPAGDQFAYEDALSSAWSWIKGDGLDLGSATTRSMLDLIGAAEASLAGAVAALKAAAEQPAPIHFNTVSDALNVAEGRTTL